MKTLSIEVAHVYDKIKSSEQFLSRQVLKKFLDENPEVEVSIHILIDNYHTDFSEEELKDLENDLSFQSSKIYYEKDFVEKSITLISRLPVDQIEDRVFLKGTKILLKKGSRVTCPILTAAWYLYRLETSGELLNILPKKFKKNEDKVKEIMKELNLNEKSITYSFF